jgi:hypothetical protein
MQEMKSVNRMPRTRTVNCGDLVLKIRDPIPYRLLDMAFTKFQKLENTAEDERPTLLLEIKEWIMKQMVVEPKLDDKFLDEEADADLWVYSFDLLAEFQESIQKRMEEVKKKHPSLSDTSPDQPE